MSDLTPRNPIPRITSLSEVERRIAKQKEDTANMLSLSEQIIETLCKINDVTLVYSMDALYNLTPSTNDLAVVYNKTTAISLYKYNGSTWVKQ